MNTCDQHYKFTGKERDAETGFDYFGARYFSSGWARFMTPDWAAAPTTVPYAAFGNPQSLNLCAYVVNSPIDRADPDGHTYTVCSNNGQCGTVDDSTFEGQESQDSQNGERFQGGQMYHYDSDGNRVNDGTYEYGGPDLNPFAQAALGQAGLRAGGLLYRRFDNYLGYVWNHPFTQAALFVFLPGEDGAEEGAAEGAAEGSGSIWPSVAHGPRTINGITYTSEALNRMAPVGMGRGVPPSAVENAIKFGAKTTGNTPGTIVHAFENVTVVTNSSSNVVITVIKTGH